MRSWVYWRCCSVWLTSSGDERHSTKARGPGIPGQVSLRVFEGARYVYEIDIGAGDSIRVELTAGETSIFRLGDRVRVEITSDIAVLLPATDAAPDDVRT